jgi:hypothetical protein
MWSARADVGVWGCVWAAQGRHDDLWSAADCGDVGAVRRMLADRADVDQRVVSCIVGRASGPACLCKTVGAVLHGHGAGGWTLVGRAAQ